MCVYVSVCAMAIVDALLSDKRRLRVCAVIYEDIKRS